jgi:adenylate cyclase class 2
VIDETPIGNYAELEGAPEWIDHIAANLGVSHSEYVTLSYGRLFERWREENQSPAEHLTFEAVSQAGSGS